MKYNWKTQLIDYNNIETYLNKYERDGWEIFDILYDINFSVPALIVMRKKLDKEQIQAMEEKKQTKLPVKKMSLLANIKLFFKNLYDSIFG